MINTKLGEITESIFDGKHGDCDNEKGSGLYFISVKDLTEYDIDYSNAREITQDDFTPNYLRTKLENGDTIYANTGDTIGKSIYVKDNELVEKTSFQKSVAVIKPNTELVDSRYLYYLLKYLTPRLRMASTGSAQKNLLLSTMRDFDVQIHDKKTQVKISNVLGLIDDRIRNILSVIKELEKLSNLLYDYWFLQFDFPDENNKPYKSSGGKMIWCEEINAEIPAKWNIMHVSDCLEVVTGREDANHATSKGQYPFFTCSSDILQCDDYKFEGKAILIAGNGDFNVKYYEGKFNAYQRTYVLIPQDDIFTGLIYHSTLRTINRFKAGSNGSIVKFITKGDVENIVILMPDNMNLLKRFNDILTQVEFYKRESKKLSALRDFLLPLMMNEQVSFK